MALLWIVFFFQSAFTRCWIQAHHSDSLFQLKSLLPVPNNSGPCAQLKTEHRETKSHLRVRPYFAEQYSTIETRLQMMNGRYRRKAGPGSGGAGASRPTSGPRQIEAKPVSGFRRRTEKRGFPSRSVFFSDGGRSLSRTLASLLQELRLNLELGWRLT